MTTTNGKRPPIDAWQVESMRVSAFPSEIVPTEQSWWNDFVGLPPEAVVSRPKIGQYQSQGDFEGRRLGLQIQPGRIDWSLSGVVKTTEEEFNLALLGPLPEVVASLLKVVVPWLAKAPALARFAFGANLLQPVENVRDGYVRLQKYLPGFPIDPDKSSDFFYQINKPQPSATGIESLRINRLMKWSVQVAQRMTVVVGPGGVETRALGEEAACRLELDINTAPSFGRTLPAERLGEILSEMVGLGLDIAKDGAR